MATAIEQPKWSTEAQRNAWTRAKEALKRDWEQTKADLGVGGQELGQGVGDTIKQVAGAVPPHATGSEPLPSTWTWDDAEQPLAFGYGARYRYGARFREWDADLAATLRSEWETTEEQGASRRRWDDVKTLVRRGYDRALD